MALDAALIRTFPSARHSLERQLGDVLRTMHLRDDRGVLRDHTLQDVTHVLFPLDLGKHVLPARPHLHLLGLLHSHPDRKAVVVGDVLLIPKAT